MEIYIVRHTTPDVAKGICYGQTDLNLVTNHDHEFEDVKSKIPYATNYNIFSSPLKRCRLLAEQLDNAIVLDDRLKELNFGTWELKAWDDISENELTPWMNDFVNTQVPGGESYTQLALRVHSFFKSLKLSDENEPAIIVTHAGPIRAFLSSLLDIPLKDSFKIKIDYGDVFHLRKEKDGFKLIAELNL